jgi:hypothetical protein
MENLVDASKEVDLEVNTEKSKYVYVAGGKARMKETTRKTKT